MSFSLPSFFLAASLFSYILHMPTFEMLNNKNIGPNFPLTKMCGTPFR